jgi:thiamine-phosphate pyrophosphorylase
VNLVQFRDKGSYSPAERDDAIKSLIDLCHRHRAPLVVNDDPRVAQRTGADGVHVGRTDPSPRMARTLLGPHAVVGVTVYGGKREEETAEAAGADYLSIGPFYPSPSKPDEPEIPLHVLDQVVHRAHVPVFAIGGINAERAKFLASRGVKGIAVVSAIMDATDPRAAAEGLRRAFEEGSRRPASS